MARRWGARLSSVLDTDDFVQEAWVIYLDPARMGERKTEVRQDVWETGRLLTHLHDWCRHHWRRVRHEVQASILEPRGDDLGESDGVGFTPEARDETGPGSQGWLEAMDEVMARCNAVEREVVLLRAEGCSYAEVSEILGITVQAAWARVFHLREKYRGL
jgi:DNA-directed RNA polymerase specialized sigma24 family protein